jgi:MFS transporter, BCD family, chlorophyll transporter
MNVNRHRAEPAQLQAEAAPLGWLGIVRLGLVQAAIGGLVVLVTSTMNRVMVVEMALPAIVPGLLVALHYFVQILRPRLGYSSDVGGRRAPWIVGGMALLAAGTVGAALAVATMADSPALGIAFAVLAFAAVGVGVGTAGTALLVLMATRAAPTRRAAAAMVTWLMMIVGFILTSVVAGKMLEPFTPMRLVEVAARVGAVAVLVSVLAVWGVERGRRAPASAAHGDTSDAVASAAPTRFADALRQVWSESHSRGLAIFIFVSMVAYSAQDLILEPYAGLVFGMTPGESTQLSGVQNSGVLLGMIAVAIICTRWGERYLGSVRVWTIAGCVGSGFALLTLAVAGVVGPGWPIPATVFTLGLANGCFAVGAIGSMMGLVGAGRRSREGIRMGLWGAAQAFAFALSGICATLLVDLARWVTGSDPAAYAFVFTLEALLFLYASLLAAQARPVDAADTARGTHAARDSAVTAG